MTFSSVRTVLYKNGRLHLKRASVRSRTGRECASAVASTALEDIRAPLFSRRRSLSTSQQGHRLIPTQHSSKRPPPICRDSVELQELTQEVLESPVGSFFCRSAVKVSASQLDDRDDAYAIAHESGELIEYLLRGYNHTISPLALCGKQSNQIFLLSQMHQ